MVNVRRSCRHVLLVLSLSSVVAAGPKPAKTTSTSTSKTTSTTSTKATFTSSTSTTTAAAISTTSTSAAAISITTTSATAVTTFALPQQSPSTTSVPSNILRGVNIGGWLILEKWMTPSLFSGTTAVDQLTFDSLITSTTALQNHWATYFTQGDVQGIAGYGMNALRIPIGFWAFDTLGTPFLSGAQFYLDQAITWARLFGLKVIVDIHGSPGSQNGWDHSGNSTGSSWQLGSNTSLLGPNMLSNIEILKQVGLKYGSVAYSDVIYGIEISNEPISWGNQNIDVTKNWAAAAYNAIKGVATNPNLRIITHDGFVGPQGWYDLASAINSNNTTPQFAVDTHLYQLFVASDVSLNMTQHIQKACDWGNIAKNPAMPVHVGEFSAAVNICVNPDGSSFGNDGTRNCTVAGCQCTDTVPITQWSPALKNVTRMYWEAQLQSFEHANAGFFLWSYKGFGAWSLVDLYNYGVIGPNINQRAYGKQCSYTV